MPLTNVVFMGQGEGGPIVEPCFLVEEEVGGRAGAGGALDIVSCYRNLDMWPVTEWPTDKP